ncbi:hypothetical protein K2173_026777 [Erythroxylum novogranatense]|uniref:RING-type E3 ubiquitin transferase n=1 Tax=Erythroxylum novogranatense TaxID=1862640 RepID=A0AAV8U0J3_9ROSI|nr:hypothetical protein K2173_026777 [Erythroxylum novogranatense]
MTSEEINNPCSSHLLFLNLNHGIFFRLLLFLLLLPLATAQNNNSPSNQSQPPTAFGLGQNFNPPMAILMVVLVGVFFLLGFFSVYIRQCSRNRNGFNPSVASIIGGAGRSRRSSPGLDPAIIDTFPTFQYSTVKGLKIGKGSLECAVCLNEFEDSETLRLIPKCSHVFHPDCIGEWLASHTTCPVCRANLVPKPGDYPVNFVYNFEPENDSVGSDQRANTDEQTIQQVSIQVADVNDPIREEAVTPTKYQDVNLLNPANQNRAPRSWSTGWSRLFPRSHSTGHSLVNPGENLDRFTLRLPKEARSQLMNNHLNRTASLVVFPRASSSRRGYRSKSVGVQRSTNLERFDEEGQPDRWGFTIPRTGSLRSSRSQERVSSTTTAHPLKSLSRSIRSSVDRFFLGLDKSNNENDGVRSTDRV